MRLRAIHSAFLVLLAVVGFVGFAAYRGMGSRGSAPAPRAPEPGRTASENREDQFLAEVRQLQAATPLSAGDGSLPPVGADPALAPDIALENTEFDVGVITNNEITHVKLKVYNRGKAALKLLNVTTTCACSFPKIPERHKTIPPGGQGYIDIALDPRRIPGFHMRKSISIYSNDPDQPKITVYVVADIEPEFVLIPEEIDFGEVAKGQAAEATMILRQLTGVPVEITSITEFGRKKEDPEPAELSFSFERRPEPEWRAPDKAEYVITALLSPRVSPGSFKRRFSINTTVKRLPGMWCYAKAEVKAFYKVEPRPPARLMLRPGYDEDRPELVGGTVTVTSERPIDITGIRADDVLVVRASVGEDGTSAYLDVSVAPTVPKGRVLAGFDFIVTSGGAACPEHVRAQGYVP